MTIFFLRDYHKKSLIVKALNVSYYIGLNVSLYILSITSTLRNKGLTQKKTFMLWYHKLVLHHMRPLR